MDSDCLKLKYSFKKKVFTEFLLPIEDYWLENNSQTFIHGKFSTGKTKREVLEIFSFYMLIYPTFGLRTENSCWKQASKWHHSLNGFGVIIYAKIVESLQLWSDSAQALEAYILDMH